MTVTVAAIVVANSADVYLSETLSQLSKQLYPISEVVVVDTATSNETAQVVSRFGFSLIQPGDLPLGAAVKVGLKSLSARPQWLWILHDDSAPEPNALSQLTKTAEISESVAIVGPKLLRWDLPVEIQQLGLTITKTGRPFLLVESEYDQGQFDVRSDTLAVSTAGMLVSIELWEKLGGFDDSTPVLAQDIEFSLKARAAGYRVVVEPTAKVLHAGLSMRGMRKRSWLGGGYRFAIERAHLHLFTLTAPGPIALLINLILPALAIAQIPLNVFNRRPGRAAGQLVSWLFGWFSFPSRWAARKRVRALGSLAGARSLYATPKQIRQKRSKQMEFPPEEARSGRRGFFASGAFYISLLLPLVSLGGFPLAAMSNAASPIGRSFESIWLSTGVDRVQFLAGVDYPSDPFNWFFALLALVPTAPSVTLNWFVFLAGTFAFISAWLLFGQFTERAWLRNLVAVGYALSPALLQLQSAGAVVELVVSVFTPLSIYLLMKAKSAFNSARTLRWIALAGLSMALVAIANPVVFLLLIVFVSALVLQNPRKFYLAVSATPAISLLLPWLMATANTNPALIFLTSSSRTDTGDQVIWHVITLAVALVLAGFANRPLPILATAFSLCALVSADRILGFGFSELSALLSLGVLLLLLLFVDFASREVKVATAAVVSVSLAVSAVSFGFMAQRPLQVEDLSAPALVVAQADAEGATRTLVISFDQEIHADLVWGDGRSADERSVLYSTLGASSQIEQSIADLTAQLIAANPARVGQLLSELGIDFVLVQGNDSTALATRASIAGMEFFQISGDSAFGSLFRVTTAVEQPTTEIPADNRNWQLAALALFLLLSVPTPATIRGYRRRVAR